MQVSIVHPRPAARLSTRTLCLTASLVSLLFVPAGSSFAASDDSTAAAAAFVVREVRVFDGERTIASTDVLVRDGRIASIGPSLDVPAGVAVIDGHGRTLLPGLIDAHTHSFGAARRDAIRFGVTTELDMFGDWHQLAEAKRTRASLARTPVADLWSAGTLATVPHGHGTEYGFPIPTLTQPSEAPAFVANRLAEGSDYLKIILEDGSAYGHPLPTLDAPTTAALVGAAHAAHRASLAHVATEAEAREAVDAGIDGLAHVFIDRPASAALVEQVRRSGTFVVATLSVAGSASGADTGRRLADDPRLATMLSAGQADSLRAVFPAEWRNAAFLPNATESVRRLHAAGVPILAGTDAGNPGTAHGVSLHGELALLVAAGLSPTEALNAATALPARLFDLGDRGRVVVGERADLMLVDGDPTRDIEATRAIVSIWKNGFPVDRALASDERKDATAAASQPKGSLVSDFEAGDIAVAFGQNWAVTTDALIGGKSTASQRWLAGGAAGSKGALQVAGEIVAGAPFTWSGSIFLPGAKPFDAVDFSQRHVLVFQVRSPGRSSLSAMLFSGAPTNRQPSTVAFDVTPQWTEVRIPLERFEGADPTRVRGLAIVAGQPVGPFAFDLDDIRIE